MIVYKYRQNSDLTDQIFTKKKIWLAIPSALNDPFETEINFGADFPGSIEKLQAAQVATFLSAAQHHRKSGLPYYGLSRKSIYSLIARFKNLRDVKTAYQEYSSFVQERTGLPPLDPATTYTSIPKQLSSLGIFSLSETSDNSLMWAHYSGNHEGICIGFEVTDNSVLADSSHCIHVTYSDTTPTIDDVMAMELQMASQNYAKTRRPGLALLSHPMIQTTIATKGLEWSYEKEWRYVESASGEHDWPAPIVEITFGLKCSKEQRDHYINLARNFVPNDVRLYEIVKIQGTKSIKKVLLGITSPPDAEPIQNLDLHQLQQLLEKRHYVAALATIDTLLSKGSDLAEVWRCKGIALGWSDDHVGALHCFTQGIAIEPNNFSLRYHKAVALTALGEYHTSIEEYKKAQDLCPWEPSFPFNLGMILLNLDRSDEALEQLEKSSRLGHPRANDAIARMKLNTSENFRLEI